MFIQYSITLDSNYEKLSRKELKEDIERLEEHIDSLKVELGDMEYILLKKTMEGEA